MEYAPEARTAIHLPRARIRLDRLRDNWNLLVQEGARQGIDASSILAMVKADAYGHGLAAVSRTLADAGARFFGGGSIAECVFLRSLFGSCGIRILGMLGVHGPTEAAEAVKHDIIPLVFSVEHLALLARAASETGRASSVPVAVKVETGMSRLGVRERDLKAFINALQAVPGVVPVMAVSHLAAADDPKQDASVARQVERFTAAYHAMREVWPDIAPSLANSAGLLAHADTLSGLSGSVVRPGYALYGGNALHGTCRESLGAAFTPVMEVFAPVLAVHQLDAGETVSYGRTFTASSPMRIAVVGAGYADGLSRSLSGRGAVCIRGRRAAILGRVCMQMHIVDAANIPEVAPGDEAYILGGTGDGRITPDELGVMWGSIPYEAFCLLGKNAREYRDGA